MAPDPQLEPWLLGKEDAGIESDQETQAVTTQMLKSGLWVQLN